MMTKKGFTLVELLVVVLIIAILAAIALPLYLGAIKDSEKKTARANMQTIANAEQAWVLRRESGGTFTADLSKLVPDLGRDFSADPPLGPGARKYEVRLGPGDCDHDGDGTGGTANQNYDTGSFAVFSTDPEDGCYIPGARR